MRLFKETDSELKRFYCKALLFAGIMAVMVIVFDILSIRDDTRVFIARITDSLDYISGNVGPDEIRPYIYRAEDPDGSVRLLLGDSVCHQMFSGLQEFNEGFIMIPSNGAITMSGQYILAHEFLEAHPEAEEIFMLMLPDSLERTYDTSYGYQYAVMPFVETDTLRYLNQDTIEGMKDTYGSFFLKYRVVNAIDPSGVNRKLYLNYLKNHTTGYRPDDPAALADEYLAGISRMCDERNVDFYLYPCPVADVKKENVAQRKQDFEGTIIDEINPGFFDNILYYDSNEASDNVHFSGEYANQAHFNEMIRKMLEGERLLDVMKFE